jgi:hypothetical protein
MRATPEPDVEVADNRGSVEVPAPPPDCVVGLVASDDWVEESMPPPPVLDSVVGSGVEEVLVSGGGKLSVL